MELESHQARRVHIQEPPEMNNSISALAENQSDLELGAKPHDARKSWLEACQPPQLNEGQGTKADMSYPIRISTTLTPEGQRQASL